MNIYADKTQENKSQVVANAVSQKQNISNSTFQFEDKRPEAIAQKKLQELANNSFQSKKIITDTRGYSTQILKTDRKGFTEVRVSGFNQTDNPFSEIIQKGKGYIEGKYYELKKNNTHFITLYQAEQAPFPTGVHCINGTEINDEQTLGLKVDLEFDSNTGEYTDIWNVLEQEVVSESKGQEGVFKGEPFQSSNSGFMAINQAKDDKHGMSKSFFKELLNGQGYKSFYGRYAAEQLDVYKDENGEEKAIQNSGYEIERQIKCPKKTKNSSDFILTTIKKAKPVSVNGFTVNAGPSPTLKTEIKVPGKLKNNKVEIE